MRKDQVIEKLYEELWKKADPKQASRFIIEMAYEAGGDNRQLEILQNLELRTENRNKINFYLVRSFDLKTLRIKIYPNEAYAAKEENLDVNKIFMAIKTKDVYANKKWIMEEI